MTWRQRFPGPSAGRLFGPVRPWLLLALISLVVSVIVPGAMFRGAPSPAAKVLEANGWMFVPVPYYIPAPALLVALLLIRRHRYGGAVVSSLISLIATLPALMSIREPLPGIVFSYATPVLVLVGSAMGLYRSMGAEARVPSETQEPAEAA